MITALVSSIVGLVSGLAPDVLSLIREGREAEHEMNMLRLQSELNLSAIQARAGARIEEGHIQLALDEAKASREALVAAIQSNSTASGIRWIDGLNAVIRPVTAILLLATMALVVAGLTETIPSSLFAPLFVEAVMAVMGFYFGYRSGRKEPILPSAGAWLTTVSRG